MNAFRLLCRDKLSLQSNIELYMKIKLILSNEKINYESKLKQLSAVLKRLTEKHIKFIDYTEEQLLKIGNVTLCSQNNSNVFCKRNFVDP